MDSSLWRSSSKELRKYNCLKGDLHVDFLVIGGGFTGCSAALAASEAGASVALLEAHSIGHGGSGRNVGLVNAGLWLPPDEVESVMGAEVGQALNHALAGAPDEVFDLIARHGIQCEATRNGTLHLAHAPRGLKDLEMRLAQQEARQAPVALLDAAETARRTGTDAYHGALHDRRAGTVQPLAYVQGLARAAQDAGAEIFTESPVKALAHDGRLWRGTTAHGTVRAKNCLLATNAYHLGIAGVHEARSAQVSFFQLATEPLPKRIGETILAGGEGCWDTALIMSSLRRDTAGRLIFGAMGNPEGLGHAVHRAWALKALTRLYPALEGQEIAHFWVGNIAMTSDHVPKAIRFGPNAMSLMGFSGRGIAPGTRLGRLAGAAVLSGSDQDLPLPVLEQYSERFCGTRTAYYESGARLIHMADRVLG
ncbi:NAD(P)/FAD-dependent oxidoreductase [Shimia aestuarii]|uniref:NAD(P)/FAD-dependent oxidoreductase n=1 Tax=Shimia aestuarii TaxID=254406 RepID=UPI001FB44711|nr:FAD-binding oxidoreductase [Shimia aestuarii]